MRWEKKRENERIREYHREREGGERRRRRGVTEENREGLQRKRGNVIATESF